MTCVYVDFDMVRASDELSKTPIPVMYSQTITYLRFLGGSSSLFTHCEPVLVTNLSDASVDILSGRGLQKSMARIRLTGLKMTY